jgi:glutamyl-tRNA synthetase
MRERKASMRASYRTRYAPSPTGAMHLGHVRTHLVAYLRARSQGGAIVMRIEDLDPPRVAPGSADAFLRDHAWLGLEWDEGPVYQSARHALYEAALRTLAERGATYPCTCSRREIEAIASAPHGDEGPIYPGTCRNGPSHPERAPAIRFRMPEHAPFHDVLCAHVLPSSSGDFVVRRADGLFSYQLAVVVDDGDMGITEVVRGMDILASTPRQVALQDALSLPHPSYLHLPLVLGADGERLAKRNGATPIAAYREAGVSRERILGLVGASLGLVEAGQDASMQDLLGAFSLDALRVAQSTPLVVPSAE